MVLFCIMFSVVLTKDLGIAKSRYSNITIAVTFRSFFQTKIGDHLAIAKKRSPIAIKRSAIGHALKLMHDPQSVSLPINEIIITFHN